MSKHIDRLEKSVGEFNDNYREVRKSIVKVLETEGEETPEALQVLAMIDSLDAVVDNLTTSIKKLDSKINS